MIFPWKDLCRRLTVKKITNIVVEKTTIDVTSKVDIENSQTRMINGNSCNGHSHN